MSSLKEIRTRISSVKTTRQVTSAMKMVSAAKLRKAQHEITTIRTYADRLHEISSSLIGNLVYDENSPYTEPRYPDRVLIILVSSNRGLCGAFNSSAAKMAIDLAVTKYEQQLESGNVSFFAIGKQGGKYLEAKGMKLKGQANDILENLRFNNVVQLAETFMADFVDKKYDRIELVYNRFKNAAVQVSTAEQFLPIESAMEEEEEIRTYSFIFEPSREKIINDLLPHSLKIQFYRTLLDSYASEHGARMTAMHKATDNATELISELTTAMNKARQTDITNEILEVTNGAESLRG